MKYLKHAEKLGPDALIAIPPTEAESADDFRAYWSGLAAATERPLFMQTTGGAKGIEPSVEMLVQLSREHSNLGYIKEEAQPIIERMVQLNEHRPVVKSIFGGMGGRAMLYEARLGMDGTMPAAPFADLYPQVWEAYEGGDREKALKVFSILGLMLTCDRQIPGTRHYIMKKRGVFKTTVSRSREYTFTPAAAAEIDFQWAACEPYLRVKGRLGA